MGNKNGKLPSPLARAVKKDLCESLEKFNSENEKDKVANNSEPSITPSNSIDSSLSKLSSEIRLVYVVMPNVDRCEYFQVDFSNISIRGKSLKDAEEYDQQSYPREIVAALLLKHYLLEKSAWPVVHLCSGNDLNARLSLVHEVDKFHTRITKSAEIYLLCTIELCSDEKCVCLGLDLSNFASGTNDIPNERFEKVEMRRAGIFSCMPSSPSVFMLIPTNKLVYSFETLKTDIQFIVDSLYQSYSC